MLKGSKHSEEIKKHWSQIRKGKNLKNTWGFKKGMVPWNKGKKTGLAPWLGKKRSKETIKKMSEALKGKSSHMLGKRHTEKTKKRISESRKGLMTGKKHPNWRGGYENTLMLNRKRRINKLGNGGNHTLGDWDNLKAQYNWACPCCFKIEPKITLSEDHIIPISRGGSDNIENIQPLCRSCNSRKHTKIIKYGI